jgi:hypothetical protein
MWSEYKGPNRTGVGERDIFRDWLRYHAVYLIKKMEGVSDEDLRRVQTQSGLCLLGILKHMTYVYRWWFAVVIGGREHDFPWSTDDPDADWRIEPEETTDGLIALFKAEVEQVYEMIEWVGLDDVHDAGGSPVDVRWIMTHMIEEAAQHDGHADILRENIDGSVTS